MNALRELNLQLLITVAVYAALQAVMLSAHLFYGYSTLEWWSESGSSWILAAILAPMVFSATVVARGSNGEKLRWSTGDTSDNPVLLQALVGLLVTIVPFTTLFAGAVFGQFPSYTYAAIVLTWCLLAGWLLHWSVHQQHITPKQPHLRNGRLVTDLTPFWRPLFGSGKIEVLPETVKFDGLVYDDECAVWIPIELSGEWVPDYQTFEDGAQLSPEVLRQKARKVLDEYIGTTIGNEAINGQLMLTNMLQVPGFRNISIRAARTHDDT